jgi:predicted Fe-Mo cluster-binding NifX family protein
MKIAIPIKDKDNLILNDRFGRSRAFYLYDMDEEDSSIIDNKSNIQSAHGSGVQTSSMLAQKGIDAIIAKEVGPKAHDILKQSNIKVYLAKDTDEINKLVDMFKNNQLEKLS